VDILAWMSGKVGGEHKNDEPTTSYHLIFLRPRSACEQKKNRKRSSIVFSALSTSVVEKETTTHVGRGFTYL
jgi:hypothetical protein